MGGEGAMMAMITSLRNNSRRKNRTQFDKDPIGSYGDAKRVEFDFPEITPQVLKTIRDRLLKEKKQLMLKTWILFSIVVTVVIILFVI
ncbi:MAG: hypothetical protein ABIO60_05020 [Aquaticitalea sp.]